MGRNSGGVTSSGKGGSSGGSKGATEKGYTAKMVKNIVGTDGQTYATKMKHCTFSTPRAILFLQ